MHTRAQPTNQIIQPAGNLLKVTEGPDAGKLALLDFGLVAEVPARDRAAMISATIHLANRDWNGALFFCVCGGRFGRLRGVSSWWPRCRPRGDDPRHDPPRQPRLQRWVCFGRGGVVRGFGAWAEGLGRGLGPRVLHFHPGARPTTPLSPLPPTTHPSPALIDDFVALEFLPPNADRGLIVPVMERVLGPYLRGGGARSFNFQALSQVTTGRGA